MNFVGMQITREEILNDLGPGGANVVLPMARLKQTAGSGAVYARAQVMPTQGNSQELTCHGATARSLWRDWGRGCAGDFVGVFPGGEGDEGKVLALPRGVEFKGGVGHVVIGAAK